jgi:glycosyltransferase involved in cell wall biosynthesis
MKLCIMPHLPCWSIRTRGWLMARALAALPEVDCHFLTWGSAEPTVTSRLRRGAETLCRALTNQLPHRPYRRDGVEVHVLSLLDPPLVSFGVPLTLIQLHNRRRLATVLRRLQPDWLITGGQYAAPVPWALTVRTAVDLFDDHFAGVSDLDQLRRLDPLAAESLERAELVLGASKSIADKYTALARRPVAYAPNGYDPPETGPDPARRRAIRARLGLPQDARVLAYLGNHGPYAGISFLLDVVDRLHLRDRRVHCAIAGPIYRRDERLRAASAPAVSALGAIEPAQVSEFLAAADLGVLPTEVSEFRSHALPLKILEYGAHRLPVVASPLRELQLQRFPHVRLAPYGDIQAWGKAVEDALAIPSQPEWSTSLETFQWSHIARDLATLLAQRGRPVAAVEGAIPA